MFFVFSVLSPSIYHELGTGTPMQWQTRDILICVKTYPEYSQKYTETVCTAGVLRDTKELVRLYPVPYRYLDGQRQFAKYQWITASISKSTDSRPESYKINADTIRLGDMIETKGDWSERKRWVLSESNICSSLEALIEKQQEHNTSLGIISPTKIVGFSIKRKADSELAEAEQKKASIMRQLDMFKEKQELDIIPFRFYLKFNCDSPSCHGHEISILDWEVVQLYRKIKRENNWEGKIRDKVLNQICSDSRDTYLIMGNMAARRHIFCILGFFWPAKKAQMSLPF